MNYTGKSNFTLNNNEYICLYLYVTGLSYLKTVDF